jgi:hypothetical protein
VSQFEFLVQIYQGVQRQTETLPPFGILDKGLNRPHDGLLFNLQHLDGFGVVVIHRKGPEVLGLCPLLRGIFDLLGHVIGSSDPDGLSAFLAIIPYSQNTRTRMMAHE